eukprot:CAMPEP_0119519026 /NCGR_PEP_ID=MMETSP1344-20130328/35465_1 /TAXON_ID=236787 /ORGANISM="Florenciella parvula, Strain CCMP2471" /LENGTH=59 /DNA_ID=CAMNT_0007556763 /DNA_START=20 /DNA_END=196 /DNA_ORIENTATION=+
MAAGDRCRTSSSILSALAFLFRLAIRSLLARALLVLRLRALPSSNPKKVSRLLPALPPL